MNSKLNSRRQVLLAAASLGAMSAASSVSAAPKKPAALPEGWPSKPIKLVVAFPPGGLTDAYARMYAEQLTAKLGATVIVENKAGAGGILAIDTVAKAPADGYTLLMTTSGTVWQNRVLYTKLPYNLDRDLTPVAIFPSGPLVVAVHESVPAQNIQEFLAWAKGRPASMGTYAPGSYPQMIASEFNRSYATKLQTVHYRGEAPMWLDLASGQVQIAVGSFLTFNTVASRGVRPIAVTGTYRSPRLPQVLPLAEQGIASRLVTLEGALPLMAPAGTPEGVLQALSRVVVEGANSERAAKLRETFAIASKPGNLEQTRREVAEVVPAWIKFAVDLNLKLD